MAAGAGLDDSTSPPTLVLCLRDNVSNMVVAKPGDKHWTVVSSGDARHWLFDWLGRVAFLSLLSFEGRCYVSSPEGSVYLLQLQPLPRLVEVVNQRQRSLDDAIRYRYVTSFLIADGEGGRVLMVRYWRYLGLLAGVVPYDPAEAFSTVPGITSRMELLEVDVAGKRLLPLRSLGRRAAFMGETHCVLVSAETFPSLAPDAVYLGYCQQYTGHFSVYHVDSRKTEPAHELDRDRMILVPRARPCSLDPRRAFSSFPIPTRLPPSD